MRHDDQYLNDALTAIRDLQEFTSRTTREEFMADKMKHSFVFHRLVILGEAAVCLSRTYRVAYPEVPWGKLTGFRNRLVHAYFDLDLNLIWQMASTMLPGLAFQLEQILRTEFPQADEPEM